VPEDGGITSKRAVLDWQLVQGYDKTEGPKMTTVEITLPDQLALEAKRAGLLSPELLEKWLRKQLKAQRVDQLFSAMDRIAAVHDPAVMSPEEVASEIAAIRSDRRQNSRG